MKVILRESEAFVTVLLREKLQPVFYYHNLSHTRRVFDASMEIAGAMDIPKNEIQLLGIAAWFHDTGFTVNAEGHEEQSVGILEDFMVNKEIEAEDLETIRRIIRATKLEARPQDVLEEIIRDADTSHISDIDYKVQSDLLRVECEKLKGMQFTDAEWTRENISFYLNRHYYHTEYARKNWQKGKDKNLLSMLKLQKKQASKALDTSGNKIFSAQNGDTQKLAGRGVETMFRVTLRNHLSLSSIADTKANILLSVNAIIISLVLANLVSKLDNPSNHYLIVPTVIFTLFTVTSIILSILATSPKVTRRKITRDDVVNRRVNLLFFGNFYQMKLGEFEWAMSEILKDRDYLYSSLTKDLYFLGKVLDKKYRLLRITYMVFMVGIIISVCAFAIAFFTANKI